MQPVSATAAANPGNQDGFWDDVIPKSQASVIDERPSAQQSQAAKLLDSARREMRQKPRSSGGSGVSFSGGGLEMIIGVLLFLTGGGLTALSYQSAEPGGRFVVFTGFILWGAVHTIRGFCRAMGE